MPKLVDLQKHKVQIAGRYCLHSKVMTRDGAVTGGWVKIRDLSGRVITVLKINPKSLIVALHAGKRVSVFSIVTKAPFKVLPIIAEKIYD